MNKRDIVNAAISGLVLLGPQVARVKRGSKGRVLVMRHAWGDKDDGRASDAAWTAANRWAHKLADTMFQDVEVYAPDGSLLAQIEPETL